MWMRRRRADQPKVNLVMTEHVLDARGLQCPLPVLRANKALKGMEIGAELQVLASDPAAPGDFASYCKTTGHVLVDTRTEGDTFAIVVRKSG